VQVKPRARDPITLTEVGRLALVGAVIVLLAAGCGSQSDYTAAKTKRCLSSEDAQIANPSRSDFVATTATGGSFVARLGDNWVTVAFGDKPQDAQDLQIAYQRFAASNVRSNITDVLRRYRNAVLLWHRHPANADLALVIGCLG
jgi:hypothetical protein